MGSVVAHGGEAAGLVALISQGGLAYCCLVSDWEESHFQGTWEGGYGWVCLNLQGFLPLLTIPLGINKSFHLGLEFFGD